MEQYLDIALSNKEIRSADALQFFMAESLYDAKDILEKGFAIVAQVQAQQNQEAMEQEKQMQEKELAEKREAREDQQQHEKELVILEKTGNMDELEQEGLNKAIEQQIKKPESPLQQLGLEDTGMMEQGPGPEIPGGGMPPMM